MPQHLAFTAAQYQVARIIVETVQWHTTEVAQGALVTVEQRRQSLVMIPTREQAARITEREHE